MSPIPSAILRLHRQVLSQIQQIWPKALGLLIAWQILFIPVANYLEFFPHRPAGKGELLDFREIAPGKPQPHQAIHTLSRVTDAWAQTTGQYQAWWLFAPEFPPASTFPALQLTYEDSAGQPATTWLRSSFEPADTQNYVRIPSGRDRLFLYEMHLGIGLTWWDPEQPSSSPSESEAWKTHFRALILRQRQSLVHYALWREQEQATNVTPAKTLILGMNRYPSPKSFEAAASKKMPTFIPMLRICRESATKPWQVTSVEGYDPIAQDYWPIELSQITFPASPTGTP